MQHLVLPGVQTCVASSSVVAAPRRDLKLGNVLVAVDRHGDVTAIGVTDWDAAAALPEGKDSVNAT